MSGAENGAQMPQRLVAGAFRRHIFIEDCATRRRGFSRFGVEVFS
jgi:hypothetical protein